MNKRNVSFSKLEGETPSSRTTGMRDTIKERRFSYLRRRACATSQVRKPTFRYHLLVASLATCHHCANAQVVFQFDATKNVTTTTSNLTWQSLGTDAPRLVADAADWGHMANNGAGNAVFNIPGIIAAPLRFEHGTSTNTVVRQIIAVVDTPIAIPGMSTLFCSTEIFRTSGRPLNKKSNLVAHIDTSRYCRATWSIDGVPSAPLRANSTHLLVITFSHDLPLHSLGIGSDTGRHDAWERGFCGSFKEIIGFSEPVPPNVVRTIIHYANLKWRLGLEVDSPSKSDVQTSRNLGCHFGPFYGSFLIIK